MDTLTTSCRQRGLLCGFTSYGPIWNHPRFPWSAFKSADFAIPQIYDSKNKLPEDYPTRAMAAWEELSSSWPIYPAFATYGKTPKQIQSLIERTPCPGQTRIGWQWRTTKDSEWKAIKESTS